MTQADRLPQQPAEPEPSLETIVEGYQSTLKSLLAQLLYDADLRKFTKETIDTFEGDMRGINKGVEDLRENPRKAEYAGSIDKIQTHIQDVIDKLYLASLVFDVSDTLEKATMMRDFFLPSLRACQEPLREAIKELNKLLTNGDSHGK